MSFNHESGPSNDPGGSIFLSENKLIETFLSLEGDPDELLAAMARQYPATVSRIYDKLKFSILQSRGVRPIEASASEDMVRAEVDRRVIFYASLENALGHLALGRTL